MSAQTQSFQYIDDGESYVGTPLYRVETPAGQILGWVARSNGKRATSWMAYTPLSLSTKTGFKNREAAATFLQRVVSES